MFKKILSLVLAMALTLSALFALASCNPQEELLGMSESPLPAPAISSDVTIPESFKIGFICLHDENSTYDLNFIEAAVAVQEALGLSNSQVIIKKNIEEGEACAVAARDLVEQGCSVIFANSFGHEDYIIQVAKENPTVQFCHATGYQAAIEQLDNFANAFANIYEGRYLAGIAAGMKLNEMIEAGEFTAEEAKIGYVGAFTYAEVVSGYTSFYLGAKSVCPTVTMDVQFTGSWFDITEENNAAKALLARGCKLISQHADSMGAPSACEDAGVPNVSYNGSTYEACPETFIVSSRINWAPYFQYIVECAVKGEKVDTDWCGGIEEGSVVLTGVNLDVAAEGTVEAIEAAIEAIKAGTLKVFNCANFTVVNDPENQFAADANVKTEGDVTYYAESSAVSAPSFSYQIEGITRVNEKF